MSAALLDTALVASQAIVALAMVLALFRLLAGPHAQDRVLALDTCRHRIQVYGYMGGVS